MTTHGVCRKGNTFELKCVHVQHSSAPGAPIGYEITPKAGAPDSIKMPLTNYTRQIVITNVIGNPGLRQIQVIMRYTAGRFQRQYILTSYISRFS
jgi:hypothetical protein